MSEEYPAGYADVYVNGHRIKHKWVPAGAIYFIEINDETYYIKGGEYLEISTGGGRVSDMETSAYAEVNLNPLTAVADAVRGLFGH